jgi:hypothetical protein
MPSVGSMLVSIASAIVSYAARVDSRAEVTDGQPLSDAIREICLKQETAQQK